MNTQRARAYGRVTQTLRDLGPAKLLAGEQELIRVAADALLFCADVASSPSTRAELRKLTDLLDHLVENGRWTGERADELRDDVWACGPGVELRLPEAA